MRTKPILILAAVTITVSSALALDQQAGVNFLVAEPSGAFDDTVDNTGLGLGLHWGVRPQPQVTIGVGGSFMSYGSESTRQELPMVDDFDLTTTNNVAGGFVFAQVRPFSGFLQPYAEGSVGLNYFWTESKLEDDDWWDDDEVARETNHDDTAPFWSAGGGLLVRLTSGDLDAKKPGVFLDLKATYRDGGRAEYLTEGDIAVVDDEPVFTPNESTTDMVTYEVGVTLTF